jgi:hypothetical protein
MPDSSSACLPELAITVQVFVFIIPASLQSFLEVSLTSLPHLRITRWVWGGHMHTCVLVHSLRRLGTAVAVLAAELACGDGVSTKGALERAKAFLHFDCVMSHTSIVGAYPGTTPN